MALEVPEQPEPAEWQPWHCHPSAALGRCSHSSHTTSVCSYLTISPFSSCRYPSLWNCELVSTGSFSSRNIQGGAALLPLLQTGAGGNHSGSGMAQTLLPGQIRQEQKAHSPKAAICVRAQGQNTQRAEQEAGRSHRKESDEQDFVPAAHHPHHPIHHPHLPTTGLTPSLPIPRQRQPQHPPLCSSTLRHGQENPFLLLPVQLPARAPAPAPYHRACPPSRCPSCAIHPSCLALPHPQLLGMWGSSGLS